MASTKTYDGSSGTFQLYGLRHGDAGMNRSGIALRGGGLPCADGNVAVRSSTGVETGIRGAKPVSTEGTQAADSTLMASLTMERSFRM